MSSPSSSTGRSSTKMLRLRTLDGVEFEVKESVARLSETVKLLMDDGCADDGAIPLPNITGQTLAKVLEYCEKHAEVEEEQESAVDQKREAPAEKHAAAVKEEESAEDQKGEPAPAEKHAAAAVLESSEDQKGKAAAEEHAAVVDLDEEKGKAAEKELKEWDERYIDVDTDILYNIVMGAHYLEVKGLMDLTVRRVVNLIKRKTPEQIRQTFGIKNDFSPEEEEEILKQDQWGFE